MAYIDRAVVYAINCLVRVRDNIDTVPVVKSLRAMKFERACNPRDIDIARFDLNNL